MSILLPFSWIFNALVFMRNQGFDLGIFKSVKLRGTVVSVGNIAVGGTGKSPVVTAVAKDILAAAGSPAIVTRGYRSGLRRGEWQVLLHGKVIAGEERSDVVADEATMQSLALPDVPVIVGSKRHDAIHNFLSACPGFKITHWILDDGFQHRQIARNIDIVLLDAREPAGALMPAGRFREPLSSLKRATHILITKAENADQVTAAKKLISSVNVHCEIAEITFSALAPLQVSGEAESKPASWGLVAGIAKPLDFERSAASLQIDVAQKLYVADHGRFPDAGLRLLEQHCDAILTTEKDFARSGSLFKSMKIPTFVLPLSIQWTGAKPRYF